GPARVSRTSRSLRSGAPIGAARSSANSSTARVQSIRPLHGFEASRRYTATGVSPPDSPSRNSPRASIADPASDATRAARAEVAAVRSAKTRISGRSPLAPPAAVSLRQRARRDRAPGARLVVREVPRWLGLGLLQDRRDPTPRGLDRVPAREQRGVAPHRVEQQPFVGLGRLAAERL